MWNKKLYVEVYNFEMHIVFPYHMKMRNLIMNNITNVPFSTLYTSNIYLAFDKDPPYEKIFIFSFKNINVKSLLKGLSERKLTCTRI